MTKQELQACLAPQISFYDFISIDYMNLALFRDFAIQACMLREPGFVSGI